MIGLMINHFTGEGYFFVFFAFFCMFFWAGFWLLAAFFYAFASKLRTPLALNHQDTCKRRWVSQLPAGGEDARWESESTVPWVGGKNCRKHQESMCAKFHSSYENFFSKALQHLVPGDGSLLLPRSPGLVQRAHCGRSVPSTTEARVEVDKLFNWNPGILDILDISQTELLIESDVVRCCW